MPKSSFALSAVRAEKKLWGIIPVSYVADLVEYVGKRPIRRTVHVELRAGRAGALHEPSVINRALDVAHLTQKRESLSPVRSHRRRENMRGLIASGVGYLKSRGVTISQWKIGK